MTTSVGGTIVIIATPADTARSSVMGLTLYPSGEQLGNTQRIITESAITRDSETD